MEELNNLYLASFWIYIFILKSTYTCGCIFLMSFTPTKWIKLPCFVTITFESFAMKCPYFSFFIFSSFFFLYFYHNAHAYKCLFVSFFFHNTCAHNFFPFLDSDIQSSPTSRIAYFFMKIHTLICICFLSFHKTLCLFSRQQKRTHIFCLSLSSRF